MPTPAAVVIDSIDTVGPLRCGGMWSRATAMARGINPRPVPWRNRPTRRRVKSPGMAAMMPPVPTTASAVRITPRRYRPSPSRPSTGVTADPASSVMVRVHWASPREMSYSLATVGTIGEPRLLTRATTMPTPSSTGMSSRCRQWDPSTTSGAPAGAAVTSLRGTVSGSDVITR